MRYTRQGKRNTIHFIGCPLLDGYDMLACIGQHFSMPESVIALATLVRDFQFAAPPGEPARTNHITLRLTLLGAQRG